MHNKLLNFNGDPFNGDIVASYVHCQSESYSGTYSDITAPASANFPQGTSPTRYFMNLPVVPFLGDLVTYPLIVKDITNSTVLSKVTGTPGINQYRVSPETSITNNVIELDSGGGQAGHVIAFDCYAYASIVDSQDFDLDVGVIKAFAGTVTPPNHLYCDGTSYLKSQYARLFSVIGTAFGSVDADHFNVPDLRGLFLRGQNDGSGRDPDAGTRPVLSGGGNTGDKVGSYEADDFLSHLHQLLTIYSYTGYSFTISYGSGSYGAFTEPTSNAGGNETRPKNVNIRYIIKY